MYDISNCVLHEGQQICWYVNNGKYWFTVAFTICKSSKRRGNIIFLIYWNREFIFVNKMYFYHFKPQIIPSACKAEREGKKNFFCEGFNFYTVITHPQLSSDTVIRWVNLGSYVGKSTESCSPLCSLLLWLITLIWA